MHGMTWFGAALAAVLSIVLCSGASASNPPLPQAIPVNDVAQTLAVAGLRVKPTLVLDAYEAYLDEFESAYLAADAEYSKIPAAPSGPDAIRRRMPPKFEQAPPEETPRLQQLRKLDERSLAATKQLVRQLCDRIADSVPDQPEQMASARMLLEHQGAHGYIWRFAPPDIGTEFRYSGWDFSSDDASTDRERRLRMLTSNIAARTKAIEQLTVEMRDVRLVHGNARNHMGAPSMAAYVRSQLDAFDEAKPLMTNEETIRLSRQWLERLAGTMSPFMLKPFPRPQGFNEFSVPDYMRMIMTISGLSGETRAKLREIGAEWMADDERLLRDYLAGDVSFGEGMKLGDARRSRFEAAIDELALALNAPDMKAPSFAFPSVERTAELSEDDVKAFGAPYVPRARATAASRPATAARPAAARRASSAYYFVPVDYSSDTQAQLADALQLTEAQQHVLQAVLADAREQWERDVQPLAERAREPAMSGGSSTTEDRIELATAFFEAAAHADRAYAAAEQCDQVLFAALDAALPAEVNRDALKIAAAGRRTGEGTGVGVSDRFTLAAIPVDVPRAVLEAPLSAPGRKAALAEAVLFASQWDTLGRERRDVSRARRVGSFTNWVVPPAPGKAVGAEVADYSNSGDANPRRDGNFAERKRVAAAWKAAEREAIERVAAVLTESDQVAWRASVSRLRWPSAYADLGAIAAEVRAIEDDELRVAAERMLATAQANVQRSGDLLARLISSLNAADDPANGWSWKPEESAVKMANEARIQPLQGLHRFREAIVAERIREVLPPDYEIALPSIDALKALDAPPPTPQVPQAQESRPHAAAGAP